MATSAYSAPAAGHLFLAAVLPALRHRADLYDDQYKSGTRKYISSLGYTIVADFGDQYSDLLGGDARHQVNLPNLMYYVP